jgi:hypothetical protein
MSSNLTPGKSSHRADPYGRVPPSPLNGRPQPGIVPLSRSVRQSQLPCGIRRLVAFLFLAHS